MSKASMVGPKLSALTSAATWKAGLKSGLQSKLGPCPLMAAVTGGEVVQSPPVGSSVVASSLASDNVGGSNGASPATSPVVVSAPAPVVKA